MEEAGFSYASNQPILWDVLGSAGLGLSSHPGYQRAIALYEPWNASERPSVPRLRGNVVEIPVSLPDDEMLLDRLPGGARDLLRLAWRRILSRTYELGELFALQLHPERIAPGMAALSAVLGDARVHGSQLWIARLDQVAEWWRARSAASVRVQEAGEGTWRLSIVGPPGTTVLVRGAETLEPTQPWADGYHRLAVPAPANGQPMVCTVQSERRPVVGVSAATDRGMTNFLRQQGYLVQEAQHTQTCSVYLDGSRVCASSERALVSQIESGLEPLVRLGRWPHGARSALCITGDIDALTLWDYGLRLLGR
jgi:hypothetical protein